MRFNHRIFDNWAKAWRFVATLALIPHIDIKRLARPAYCARCGAWTFCSSEIPALTTRPAFICEECADVNDDECRAAWQAFCNW